MAQNSVAPDHDRLTFADGFVPVSYTHLDVYKRQEEPYINEDDEPQIAEDAETDGDED